MGCLEWGESATHEGSTRVGEGRRGSTRVDEGRDWRWGGGEVEKSVRWEGGEKMRGGVSGVGGESEDNTLGWDLP